MKQLAYDIRPNENGGFYYYDFYFWFGASHAESSDGVYKNFETREEAEAFAKERGGFYAYD
jgi:hypothetical protein